MVDQGAASAGKVILLKDCDIKSCLCEARCGRDAADAGTWIGLLAYQNR